MTHPTGPPIGSARTARLVAFGARHATASLTRGRAATRSSTTSFMADMKGLPQKLGQLLATRNDTLHRRYETLLVEGAPVADAGPIRLLHDELGPRASTLASTLTRISSSSLAQVYRGQLPNGSPVAVKIQVPGIHLALAADVRNIGRLVRILAPLMPASSRSDPKSLRQLTSDLGAALLRELDYAREATHLAHLGGALSLQPGLRCPRPLPGWCSPQVLTSTWIEGHDWIDAMRHAPQERRELTLRQLVEGWLTAGFQTGLLHADPHPGNLLAAGPSNAPLATTALLDFGQVLRGDRAWWLALKTLITSSRARDAAPLNGAYQALGFAPDWIERAEASLLPLSESLLAPFIATQPFELSTWNSGAQLDDILAKHPIQLPWELVLVQRTFQGLFAYAQRFEVSLNWGEIVDRAFAGEPGFTDRLGGDPTCR